MRKILTIILILVLMPAICGCIGDKALLSDEAVANGQMDALLDALEDHNTEKIAELFAPNALQKIADLQRMADDLYLYYRGEYTAYDNWNATNSSYSREGDHVVKELHGTYDVTTDAGVYRFTFHYVAEDSAVADNVGLWSVYVIKMEDDTDPEYAYRGDGNYTPGIQIGIPNEIPEIDGEMIL